MVAQIAPQTPQRRGASRVGGTSHQPRQPYPYTTVQPIWRRDPMFRPTPFAAWLEARCAERELTVSRLAERIVAALPMTAPGAIGPAKQSAHSVAVTMYDWLRRGVLPRPDRAIALARALEVSEADVLAAMQATPVLPPPPKARTAQAKAPPAYDPMQSPAAVHAQMWERFIADLLAKGQWTVAEARAFADRVRQAADAHERGMV